MEHVDYLIIGGGIAGITMRHFLQSKNVVVLESKPGRYKIGESIIPEHFKHPEFMKLLPAMRACPSYSPKLGTTFVNDGVAAFFPLEGDTERAMHITRTEMEQVMLDAWKVERRYEKAKSVDLERKVVLTDTNEYKVKYQIIDCSGPAMALAHMINDVRQLWPVWATWSYWDIEEASADAFFEHGEHEHWQWRYYDRVGLRFGTHERSSLPGKFFDWNPATSTTLTKVGDNMWTWQIPLFNHTRLSYGVVSRDGPVTREQYMEITNSKFSRTYRLKHRPTDGSSEYNRWHVRNNFARSASVPSTDDYILLSDAFAFADPVYSVGTGLAVNKAIEVATILNETGWTPGVRDEYNRRYIALIDRAIAGFEFWYKDSVLKDSEAAVIVQNELLIGDVFESQIRYHYFNAIEDGDLHPELYGKEMPFAVQNLEDATLLEVTAKVTRATQSILDADDPFDGQGWKLDGARPARGGLLQLWSHAAGSQVVLLLQKAELATKWYKRFGDFAIAYIDSPNDDAPPPEMDKVEQLVDLLEEPLTGYAEDWNMLLDKIREPRESLFGGVGSAP